MSARPGDVPPGREGRYGSEISRRYTGIDTIETSASLPSKALASTDLTSRKK